MTSTTASPILMVDGVDINLDNYEKIAAKYAVAFYLGGTGYDYVTYKFDVTKFVNGYLPIIVPSVTDTAESIIELAKTCPGKRFALDVEIDASNDQWLTLVTDVVVAAHSIGKEVVLYTPIAYYDKYVALSPVVDAIWSPDWINTLNYDLTNIPGVANLWWDGIGQRAVQVIGNKMSEFTIPLDYSVVDYGFVEYAETPIDDNNNTYTVVPGDTLWGIAQRLNVPFETLLSLNLSLLNTVAQAHNMTNSSNGRWIFPGTVLKY